VIRGQPERRTTTAAPFVFYRIVLGPADLALVGAGVLSAT
jgi:hypothetical protein